ncbi:MAG TPA: alpha/beta hydrolase [Verrucomicrobiae bacterium]|jgi:pimeloyl-ACP methyl ester carboxylesterase|nr:alpha/beta hydrolase [Verrucomicrobiae bacterium]
MKNKLAECAIVLALVAMAGFGARGWASPAQETKLPPLEIAREGYIFAGGNYSVDGKAMDGQIYAEFQIPAHQSHPYPIVFIHGGNQTGTNFTGTPDGREGWAQFFLRQGYAVYVVDVAGRGRSAYLAGTYGPQAPVNLDFLQRRFTAIEKYNAWPQAHLHTQWPGTGAPGDPVFDQFYASQVPSMVSYPLQQELSSKAIIALLDRIGPAVILTHSQSGATGWPVADARPEKVKAIIAVEPSGPPFYNVDNVPAPEWWRDSDEQRPWGIAAGPLTYSPPAAAPSDLAIERQQQPDNPDVSRCWLQKSPARQLPNLQKMPILVVTSESSYHRGYDHCTVKYLEQSGVHVTWTKLEDIGIHGNGHMMMLEKNNQEIAAVMARWMEKMMPTAAKSKTSKPA